MARRGLLVVFAGASGVGKGTIMKQVLPQDERFRLSVSATTRLPREGEVDGREYYFITRERYDQMVRDGMFLEHAEYCGNGYGTPKAPVMEMLDRGLDVFLEIELNGFLQVKEAYPELLSIFVVPPSMDELRARLIGRGTETDESIESRLCTAMYEISQKDLFDHIIINDDVDRAAGEVLAIIRNKREENLS